MQEGKENRWVKLDPRTELLLLILANVIAFTSYTPIVELTLIGLLVLLLAICGCGKTALKWIVLFACLLGIQYFLIPFLPKVLAVMFIILTVYARKIFPCLIVGTLMLKTTPVRFFLLRLENGICHSGLLYRCLLRSDIFLLYRKKDDILKML